MFGKAYDRATLTITAVHSIVTDNIWHYEAEYTAQKVPQAGTQTLVVWSKTMPWSAAHEALKC